MLNITSHQKCKAKPQYLYILDGYNLGKKRIEKKKITRMWQECEETRTLICFGGIIKQKNHDENSKMTSQKN